jgi:hypothetical protein
MPKGNREWLIYIRQINCMKFGCTPKSVFQLLERMFL